MGLFDTGFDPDAMLSDIDFLATLGAPEVNLTDLALPADLSAYLSLFADVPPGQVPLGPASSLIDPFTGQPLPVKDLLWDIDLQQIVTSAGETVPFTFGVEPLTFGEPFTMPEAPTPQAAQAAREAALAEERRARGLDPVTGSPATAPAPKPGIFERLTTPQMLAALLLGGAGIGTGALLAATGEKRPTFEAAPRPETLVGRDALQRALTVSGGALERALDTPSVLGPDLALRLATTPTGETVFLPGQERVPSGAEDLEAIVRQSLAGQRALSGFLSEAARREALFAREQAPAERLLRLTGLADLPLFLAPTPEEGADPIQALLEQRILAAGEGRFASPALERRLAEEKRLQRARLFQQLGRDFELSTPGIQTLSEFNRMAEELRQEEERREIAGLTGLEESRRRLAEERRRTGLQERAGLTTLGRTPTAQLLTGLQGLVPAAPLLGIESESDRRLREALAFQSALGGFESEQAGRQALAQSISKLFGLGSASLLFNR